MNNENANDMFVEDVTGNIAHFKTVQLTKLAEPEYVEQSHDQSVYFENDIIKVVFADNEWSMAVGCIPVMTETDDYDTPDSYDVDKFNEESTKFFRELLTIYTLRKPNGAWMSSDVTSIEEPKKVEIKTENKFTMITSLNEYKKIFNKRKSINENWQMCVQDNYDSLEELTEYDEVYNIVKRLGYSDVETLWNENPVISGGTDPADLKVVKESVDTFIGSGISSSDKEYKKNLYNKEKKKKFSEICKTCMKPYGEHYTEKNIDYCHLDDVPAPKGFRYVSTSQIGKFNKKIETILK